MISNFCRHSFIVDGSNELYLRFGDFLEQSSFTCVKCSHQNEKQRGLLKTALIGAAVSGAVKYLTKQGELGRTKLDEIKEKAPEWLEKAKGIKSDIQA